MAGHRGESLSGSRTGGRRRAEDFPVRQWLKLGVASAGMGAALLGFSLLSPELGTASADTGAESSAASSDSGGAGDAGPSASDAGDSDAQDSETAESDADDSESAGDEADAVTDDEDDANTGDDDEDEDEPAVAEESSDDDDLVEDAAALTDTDVESLNAESDEVSEEVDPDEEFVPVTPSPYVSGQSSYDRWVEDFLDEWTDNHQEWVDSLQVSEEKKAQLQESFVAMRRTFFNQAPTVAPVQITGVLSGSVTGSLGGRDADGDELTYVLTKAPTSGVVVINADGTYSYTPTDDFNGVDSFRVAAFDAGSDLNLLDLFRPAGSAATSLINQGAVKFDFRFTTGAQYWTPDRRQALNNAANELILSFRVTKPVSLTYDVRGQNNASSSTLASAESKLTSTRPGFWPTVVQHKILTGVDANGLRADGTITWNFGKPWALGNTIPLDSFDFKATAMHELLHSFGYDGRLVGPGRNRTNRNWSTYDRFLVDRNGRKPIAFSLRWSRTYDPILIGRNGGLYFGGRNAVAAYEDNYVPLYAPNEWSNSSSAYHLDTNTFRGVFAKMMNHATGRGLGPRWVSNIELGILTDLGYIVVPRPRVQV